MNRLSRMAVLLSLAVAGPVAAETLFRLPLSTASNHCTGTRCYVTAYYDLNRGSGVRDFACGARTYNQHTGTDIGVGGFAGMDAGRPVLAAAAGTVIAAHDGEFDRCTTGNCGTANYVKIRHADGKITLYWHLKKWSVKVKVGQTVACGQQIGLVGSSGTSTGPHLHFGVQHPTWGIDDPFKGTGSCGGSVSWWVNQGAYRSLPGAVCQGGNPPPPPPPPPPTNAIVVDSNNAKNDAARGYIKVSGNWKASASTSGFYGTGYYFATVSAVSDAAEFYFYLPSAQTRTIDAWWTAGTNRSSSAPFVAFNASGAKLGTVNANQRVNGGKWNTLGTFNFSAGWNRVVLSRWTSTGDVVIADAVRIR